MSGLACGGGAPAVTAGPMPAAEPAAATPRSLRDLAPEASFGDLVRTATHLGRTEGATANAACLFTASGDGQRFTASVGAPFADLPAPPKDSRELLKDGRAPALLTWYGVLGGRSDATVTLVEFTLGALPSTQRYAVVLLDDDGATLFETDLSAPTPVKEPKDLRGALEDSVESELRVVFTATEAVSVRRIALWLASVDGLVGVNASLAVALPAGTKFPADARASAAKPVSPCGEWPALKREGSVDGVALSEGLRSVLTADSLMRCALRSETPGRIHAARLRLRIDASGAASNACFVDSTDAAFERCLSDTVLLMPKIAPPGGEVDVELPLSVQIPEAPARVAGLCAAN